MSREWKPGDVALVHGRVCVRLDNSWEHGDPRAFRFADGDALDARRLVVIDPEDAEQVKRFDDLLSRFVEGDEVPDYEGTEGATRAALREYANPTPPKPDEPQGLGAVVEDAEGRRWVRTNQCRYPWSDDPERDEDGDSTWQSCLYSDIAVVRVLSEGVTA